MFFPQIGPGSIAQYPVGRVRRWRSITNEFESGERITLADTTAGQIEWKLAYRDLNDAEVQKLATLFNASQGRFGSFLFVDPLANLLAWSEDLAKPNWQFNLLRSESGVADPQGTLRASTVSNGAAGSQTLGQTLALPGEYVACFSFWVRANSPGAVTLARDSTSLRVSTGPAWKRVVLSATGTPGATQSTFTIALDAGQTLDLWGLQIEAQSSPGPYKPSAQNQGIFGETYFAADELVVTSTGVGLSACEIALISRI